MRQVVFYACDICNVLYPDKAGAARCEARGIPDRPSLEIGTHYCRIDKYKLYMGKLNGLRLDGHHWKARFGDCGAEETIYNDQNWVVATPDERELFNDV